VVNWWKDQPLSKQEAQVLERKIEEEKREMQKRIKKHAAYSFIFN